MSTTPELELKVAITVREASRALSCLYIELDEAIVTDVKTKVEAAFSAYAAALAQRERETWEQAAQDYPPGLPHLYQQMLRDRYLLRAQQVQR